MYFCKSNREKLPFHDSSTNHKRCNKFIHNYLEPPDRWESSCNLCARDSMPESPVLAVDWGDKGGPLDGELPAPSSSSSISSKSSSVLRKSKAVSMAPSMETSRSWGGELSPLACSCPLNNCSMAGRTSSRPCNSVYWPRMSSSDVWRLGRKMRDKNIYKASGSYDV